MSSTIRPACAGACAVLNVAVLNVVAAVCRIHRCLLIGALIAAPAFLVRAAHAQDDERLTILITASRFAETVDQTLAPVTVITREEIEDTQASTVEEALRAVPGVAFTNQGGAGKLTAMFLRGTESNHVLVLIDGVKVGSATAGTTRFEHLPLDQIEKIEVVRGPRSSLYGSEAIGGVIQIFTRKGDGAPRPHFSASVGSHDARKMALGVSGREGRGWYSIGLSGERTDGFDGCTGDAATFAGCASDDETDDDGHENRSVSLRGGAALSDAFSIEGNLLNSESETEFDGNFQNESETTNRTASVKLNFRPTENLHSSLLVARHQDQSQNFVNCDVLNMPVAEIYFGTASVPPCVNAEILGQPGMQTIVSQERIPGTVTVDAFNTERNQFAWQGDVRLNDRHRMIIGVDHINDKIDSTVSYAVNSRDNLGVFTSWRTTFDADDIEFSLREDDNEQFGDTTTGGIGWGRSLGGGHRVTASYGTAFTVPTFNELYYPFSSNPNLKPEKSRSFDFGLAHNSTNHKWSFNFYRTKVDDLIANDSTFTPFNINKAKITGLELSGAVAIDQWNVSANLTTQNPRDADTGARLIRRPKHIINLDASRQFGAHSVGVALHHQGDSPDGGGTIAGHSVIDLRWNARVHRHWSLGVKINNLFDREYQTARHYPQDERNTTVTLRYLP